MQTAKGNVLLPIARILLVEDDTHYRHLLETSLRQEGFDVIACLDGLEALNCARSMPAQACGTAFDLMILDRTLPRLNGLDVCRLLRQEGNSIPIVMMSEQADEHDKVIGLELGADEYLSKPFSNRILIARCRALLRHCREIGQPKSPAKVLKFKDLALYLEECRATLSEQELKLSPKEFALLREFLQSRGRILSRDNLLERIWGDDYYGDAKTVEVHIHWLRQKLERDPSKPEYITTLRGFGYRLG
ncbi:response regulator transcription factor [Cyanobacteria bacterium FACHB-63]|nr:response regulator transcription factor [Cyanobacteria bacterium FACHB-63]